MKKSLKNFSLKSLLLLAVVAVGMVSCSDDENNPESEGKANLRVSMTDAPGDYDAVFVEVVDVMIQTDAAVEGAEGEGEGAEEGWVSVGDVQTGVYDLLELTGGVSQVLADTEVPAGYVSQIRLVLGTDNYVVIDGEEEPLSTPSAQQSGLKLQLNQELEAGENYSFLLDFDVDKSVVTTGNGGKSLKPVIRLSAEADAGMIVGAVHPTEFRSLVTAKNATTTISAYTDANGEFALKGVPAGTYQVSVTPDVAAGLDVVFEDDVVVEENSTIDLETIFLE
ncbi:DUF4382 domain-containing protein [Salegentibacter chungangensis]|uniref:DUF4382 domain-containing protein n=1 Tax=Salegentibacter chungangensis TaxID=1335724 RepID=A0ABW3NN12_9FLAO